MKLRFVTPMPPKLPTPPIPSNDGVAPTFFVRPAPRLTLWVKYPPLRRRCSLPSLNFELVLKLGDAGLKLDNVVAHFALQLVQFLNYLTHSDTPTLSKNARALSLISRCFAGRTCGRSS